MAFVWTKLIWDFSTKFDLQLPFCFIWHLVKTAGECPYFGQMAKNKNLKWSLICHWVLNLKFKEAKCLYSLRVFGQDLAIFLYLLRGGWRQNHGYPNKVISVTALHIKFVGTPQLSKTQAEWYSTPACCFCKFKLRLVNSTSVSKEKYCITIQTFSKCHPDLGAWHNVVWEAKFDPVHYAPHPPV